MKLIFIELFIIMHLLFGQFPSYDISEVDGSKFVLSVKPLIRSTSFSLGHHQLVKNDLNQRFYLSIVFPFGYDLTSMSFIEKSILGLPLLHSSLLISNNLRLNGKIGGFTSHDDVINYYSYGFTLGLVKDNPSLWIADLSVGKIIEKLVVVSKVKVVLFYRMKLYLQIEFLVIMKTLKPIEFLL